MDVVYSHVLRIRLSCQSRILIRTLAFEMRPADAPADAPAEQQWRIVSDEWRRDRRKRWQSVSAILNPALEQMEGHDDGSAPRPERCKTHVFHSELFGLVFSTFPSVANQEENYMNSLHGRMDKSGFVGSFCCLSRKGLCLLVRREERHAKH